jgi:hypothetical protein
MDDDLSALRSALVNERRGKRWREPPVPNVPPQTVTNDALRHANAWSGALDRWALGVPSTVSALVTGRPLAEARAASEFAQNDFKTLYHRDLLAMGPRRLKDIKGLNDFAIGLAGKLNLD